MHSTYLRASKFLSIFFLIENVNNSLRRNPLFKVSWNLWKVFMAFRSTHPSSSIRMQSILHYTFFPKKKRKSILREVTWHQCEDNILPSSLNEKKNVDWLCCFCPESNPGWKSLPKRRNFCFFFFSFFAFSPEAAHSYSTKKKQNCFLQSSLIQGPWHLGGKILVSEEKNWLIKEIFNLLMEGFERNPQD